MTYNRGDEQFAWNTALLIMALFSAAAVALRTLGTPIFNDQFVISLVYIPTSVLLLGFIAERRKGSARIESP